MWFFESFGKDCPQSLVKKDFEPFDAFESPWARIAFLGDLHVSSLKDCQSFQLFDSEVFKKDSGPKGSVRVLVKRLFHQGLMSSLGMRTPWKDS